MTLLPLLAEALGITVDELLAGETCADAPMPEQDAPQPSEIRRAYAAQKLADADSWLLLAFSICVPAFIWYTISLGMQGSFRLQLLCILFAACSVWHSGTIRRLRSYAGPDDLSVSRRRATLLRGGYAATALLFGIQVIAPAFSEYLMVPCGRYQIVLEVNQFYWGLLVGLLLLLVAALGVLAYRYFGMTAQTCLDPLMPGVVSAVPFIGAVVLLYLRVSRIVSFVPPSDERALVTVKGELNTAMEQLLSGARIAWAIGTVVLMALCVVLCRIKRCSVTPTVLLPCAALQSLLWYAVGTSDWFLLLRFPSVLHQEQVGTITILVTACFFMLVFSLLIWVICTLLSGIRRKPEPSTTSTS